MAYPYLIDGADSDPNALSELSPRPLHRLGATLYVVAVDMVHSNVEVWSSTDDGVTWAELDAANHPAVHDVSGTFGAHEWVTIDAARDQTRDELHVLYIAGSTRALTVRTFNLGADTWGTVRTGPTFASTFPEDIGSSMLAVMAMKNDGSSFDIAYQDFDGSFRRVTSLNCTYAGSFSTTQRIPRQGVQLADVCPGTSARTHIFYWAPASIYQTALNSSNVLQTEAQLPADVPGVVGGFVALQDGSNVILVWNPTYQPGGGVLTSKVFTEHAVSADTPTWTEHLVVEVSRTDVFPIFGTTTIVRDDDGLLYAIWGEATAGGSSLQSRDLFYSVFSAGAWGGKVAIYSASPYPSTSIFPAFGNGLVSLFGLVFGLGAGDTDSTTNTLRYPLYYWQRGDFDFNAISDEDAVIAGGAASTL